jgi:hypothetical protein
MVDSNNFLFLLKSGSPPDPKRKSYAAKIQESGPTGPDQYYSEEKSSIAGVF